MEESEVAESRLAPLGAEQIAGQFDRLVNPMEEDSKLGAAQYGFFASESGEATGLEEEGLEGGLEAGVEAPPEEEEVEGGFEQNFGMDLEGEPFSAAQLPFEPGRPPLLSTSGLSEGGEPRKPNLERRSAPAEGSVSQPSHSFLSDPIAGPPLRAGPSVASSWISATSRQPDSGAAQAQGSQANKKDEPGPTIMDFAFPAGVVIRESMIKSPRFSRRQPQREGPFSNIPQQASQPWAQRGGQALDALNLSRPSGALTVEDIEARMLASSLRQPTQGAPHPASQLPSLSRNSMGSYGLSHSYPDQPTSLKMSTGAAAGLQQGVGAAGLQQSIPGLNLASSLNPASGLGMPSRNPQQPLLNLAQNFGRHSPMAGQSHPTMPSGGTVQPPQPGIYGLPRELQGPPQFPFRQPPPQPQPPTPLTWQQHMGQAVGRGAIGRGFGGQPSPSMAPGGPFPRPGFGEQGMPAPTLRRRLTSKYMDAEEIESILRIQWRSLHNGPAYVEDYYYQAYVYKHTKGANQSIFAPDALRDLAPSERLGAEPAMYVKLEGLGKIPYSNVRRPKPLMDLVAAPITKEGSSDEGGDGEARTIKPLEEEPLLAARIVIEDCMCLLLDVDDIDRVWAASRGMRDDEHLLRQRRSLLMDAFASSMRLPDGALPPAGGRASDAVFIRLMGLQKGRTLLARAIRLMTSLLANPAGYAGPAGRRPPPLRIVWAALRNVRLLFGVSGASSIPREKEAEYAAAQRMMEATSRVARASVEVMRRLESPRSVCDCMAALVKGDLALKGSFQPNHADNLLPLTPTGEPADCGFEWLGDIVIALLQCAEEKGLAAWSAQRGRPGDGLAGPEGIAWRDSFAAFFVLLSRHLNTLAEVNRLAMEAGSVEAANYAKQIVPTNLIKKCLLHTTAVQRDELRSILERLI